MTEANIIDSEYSVSDLVTNDSKYSAMKEILSEFPKGSDEYLKHLIDMLPLCSWPDYKAFLKCQANGISEMGQESTLSPIFRSSMSNEKMITCIDKRLNTVYAHFMFSVRTWPNNDCIGWRPFNELTEDWEPYYVWESYATVAERAKNFGSGIMSLVNSKRGKPLHSNDFIVAILSHNIPEWIITDIACQSFDLTNTCLYETLGEETSEYIMNLTESPILVFAKVNLYKILNILPELKHVNTLISMEELSQQDIDSLNNYLITNSTNQKGEKVSFFTMKQVEQIGILTSVPVIPPKSNSLYTISFTSGTTGLPKGVELTHQNATAGITFALSTFKVPANKRHKQLHDMCFLPLTHIFQRQTTVYSLARGVGLGFLHTPDPTVLVEDCKILKPDAMALVPRILTRFEAGIKNSLAQSTIQKNVAANILESKTDRFTKKGGSDRSIMNRVVYHNILIDKIRDSLGFSNSTYIITGSAPIAKDTLLFLRSALDIGMRQGYGLTESFAGICLSEPYERDVGSCGAIGITAECRLKDVPQMGYFAQKDLKGELQLRGPQVFKKYYKNSKDTEASIDKDGWFSTGDVGYIDSKGRIHIIDRVKNFFKLAHGEYIAPEKIENIYLSSCPYITQAFVYGDPLKNFLVGILGIDLPAVQGLLGKKNHSVRNWAPELLIQKLNEDIPLRRQLLAKINKSVHGLQGFEKLHNIYVGLDLLKVEDDTVTPTLKIKRVPATKFFKSSLDKLYEEGSIIKNGKL